MKHNVKITILILAMFLATQFIGLYVVNEYLPEKVVDGEKVTVSDVPSLPYGMETPQPEEQSDYNQVFASVVLAFMIALGILFLLMRYKAEIVLKIWFAFVVLIALGIFFNAILPENQYSSWFALIIALPLMFFKVFKRNIFVHNTTELLIYPGIAAVFVPILNIWTIVALLVVISIYDIWAVWHSGVMQKMAKFQMNKVKVFSGFFIPYLSKKMKNKIKKMKKPELKKLKKKGVRARVAILGGGDVIFPIITAGVVLKTLGFIPAILTIFGALLGLGYLFFFAKQQKYYPAMPFISTGLFLGMGIGYILTII
ncbi:MAG TPA: presenilin family intramembrane aspartyl protease [Candidatus Nanoarchaeia archaeon]|nr:presenilin family intramembrane aspartyl protease [Candidatus Nanoarchaeia archaeon]